MDPELVDDVMDAHKYRPLDEGGLFAQDGSKRTEQADRSREYVAVPNVVELAGFLSTVPPLDQHHPEEALPVAHAVLGISRDRGAGAGTREGLTVVAGGQGPADDAGHPPLTDVADENVAATKYRSLPIEVEAMQWTGDRGGAVALRTWMDQQAHMSGLDWTSSDTRPTAALWVVKSQRWCPLDVGDYVVAEPDGDGFYPCKRAIFEDRYEMLPAPPVEPLRPACPACGARSGMHPYVACDGPYHRARRVDDGFEPLGWHATVNPT